MGIKKLFKIKPPEDISPEQNRKKLLEQGIPVKDTVPRSRERFSAYGKYASDRTQHRQYAPSGYEAEGYHSQGHMSNEEADLESLNKAPFDPYETSTSSLNRKAIDPYAVVSSDLSYGERSNTRQSNTYTSTETYSSLDTGQSKNDGSNPYACMKDDVYSSGSFSLTGKRQLRTQSEDTVKRAQKNSQRDGLDELDLNAVIDHPSDADDLNNSIHEEQSYNGESKGFRTFEDVQREAALREQQMEDEDVDEIKREIRFTKQSSVASTRNTLKMAQDAEVSGTNTLGMLGHQSEKLNDVEQNLHLIKMQNRAAENNVAELKKLNRNILAVHVGNPFTSKRKMREAEARIKSQKRIDNYQQEELNSNFVQSTRRIESALKSESGIRERYERDRVLDRAKQYQFEQDEEDNEMELEISRNLDKIGQVSSRLRKLALSTGQEVDAQRRRIEKIEEDADGLDVRIHMNTSKMTNIR
ncbi:HER194Wp [Eremothecium sinecaudum]|uniref:HER194Wp n=1 Tax=Eremothecium sinecaudum TaxID=45286 RepID=A0A0X8HU63_9SACH|nr:HER194Wp [Eremothecium sinecaudum]AMD21473.1 HER194Wp [Eremothecium sinecaudum]